MSVTRTSSSWPRGLAPLGIVLLVAACAQPQTAPTTPAPAPQATAPAPVTPPPAPEPAPAVAAPVPEVVPPAIARPQAQKLALEAVDQLQNGDEATARQTIERALALDPANELARKLNDQIRADAQKELGATFFRYTVQKDDTLSKLAAQFLGDRFRFYILAKYNDISNPSRLSAGQAIKIPGRAPPPTPSVASIPVPAAPSAPAEPPPPTAKPEPVPSPRDEAADMLARGQTQEKAGNLEAAYFLYVEAAQRYPANTEAAKRRDTARAGLIRAYDREATQAFQRQNLELAISKWDRILELDPGNRKARLERERAVDLQSRIAAKAKPK